MYLDLNSIKRIVRQFWGLCFFCSFVVVALEKNIFDKLLSIRCTSLLDFCYVSWVRDGISGDPAFKDGAY